LRARVNGHEFTRLLPPPKGSGFPPMTSERIVFMKTSITKRELPVFDLKTMAGSFYVGVLQ